MSGCSDAVPTSPTDVFFEFPAIDQRLILKVNNATLFNLESTIPPQCYTRTEQKHNPCYVCHQAYPSAKGAEYRMNKLDDAALQGTYLFSDVGENNHWSNLFVDRRHYVDQISDATILKYIDQDNYSPLEKSLTALGWKGFMPDLTDYAYPQKAFEKNGLARDGSHWVTFNYKPFPSTFWPTNGSTDDVAIRLPPEFHSHQGHYDASIYWLNLAQVEMTIKSLVSIDVPAFDEVAYQIDIDGDGLLDKNTRVMTTRHHYWGDAQKIQVIPQQFPQGTEFLHSVRYVGVAADDQIVTPPRMKELRYMKKIRSLTESELDNRYRRERKEKRDLELPYFVNHGELGMENNFGWLLTAFIEDNQGQLRPQSTEETTACMGCHSSVGSTIDQTFAFARKVTGTTGWGYLNLHAMFDAPSVSSERPEILEYFTRVGGGDEFRQNPEMRERWFQADGRVDEHAVTQADVYQLITPSRERALKLNKAYTHIVRTQSFALGRDASWIPAKNVYQKISLSQAPIEPMHRLVGWDLRLDWSRSTDPRYVEAGRSATSVIEAKESLSRSLQ